MPIHCPLTIRNLSQPEFDERDAVVMRCAYAAQNTLGRLCDERVYENDLLRRLRAEGFSSVHVQVPVQITHDGFRKEYRFDLLGDNALYELKTTNAFAPEHQAQALHYAMLADVNHAKLLNFRPGKVQGRLVYNTFRAEKRNEIRWYDQEWHPLSSPCEALRRRLRSLLRDWGACLEVRLYEEALVHFFGGEAHCVRRVPVVFDGVTLGSHVVQSHAEGLCFLITAFSKDVDAQRSHIKRLLVLTGLRSVQWINLNHTCVQLITIQ